MNAIRKYIVEMIGTFFLVLTVGLTVIGHTADDGVIPPLAIGSALMVMVYAGGHISGGHYNPAVTLGVAIRGKCGFGDALAYWVSQVLGAVAAAFLVVYLKGQHGSPMADPAGNPELIKWIVAEAVFTFALVFVVLSTATSRGAEGKGFYGLAIGFTVMVGAFAVGGLTGGAFNPAVAIGATVMGLFKSSYAWAHVVADFGGGLVAGVLFRALNLGDD